MESVKFAAPDNDEWKKKKNYGPAALFTVLLLGTAFLAGNSYAAYGSNAPTGSLLAMDGMSTLGRCPHVFESGGAPKECPAGQEFWHVSGITDDQNCLEKDRPPICGDLCVGKFDSALIKLFATMAPNSHGERPRKGSCRSISYTTDSGCNIAPLATMPNFAAYIYTK